MNIHPQQAPFKYSYFLPLHPRVLKNSRILATVGGRARSFPSKVAKAFMKEGARAISAVQGPPEAIGVPVRLRMVFHGPWGGEDKLPDLSNLYQAVEDLLEECGVLANDTLVASHDGSRRVALCPHCPDRPVLRAGPNKGRRKESCGRKKTCPHMGVLVEITPFEDAGESAALAAARFSGGRAALSL